MDCWQREIARSRTEADVLRNAGDFMALWSPRELAPITRGWRPMKIENADDLERVTKWVVEDVAGTDATTLRELGDYLWYASARMRQIRRN